MTNPFKVSEELLRYLKGELEDTDRKRVEALIAGDRDLQGLIEELQDKERIRVGLERMDRFDVEQALKKVDACRHRNRFRILGQVAAAIAVIAIGFYGLHVYSSKGMEENVPIAGPVVPGIKVATLKMSDGANFRLDTLAEVHRSGEHVICRNGEGVLTLRQEDTRTGPVREPAYNRISVPYGGKYSVILSDSTKVVLNSGSSMEFPASFTTGPRVVRLMGEAYFDVRPDAARPFIVKVDGMQVKVLGTSFNVKSYGDEQTVYTTLVRGSVAVGCAGKPELAIAPGQQASFNRNRKTIAVHQVNVEDFVSWKDGVFSFNNLPFGDILKIIARSYDLEVFYAASSIDSIVFSGKIPMYPSVLDVLRKFELSDEVAFDLKGRTLTVFGKRKTNQSKY